MTVISGDHSKTAEHQIEYRVRILVEAVVTDRSSAAFGSTIDLPFSTEVTVATLDEAKRLAKRMRMAVKASLH